MKLSTRGIHVSAVSLLTALDASDSTGRSRTFGRAPREGRATLYGRRRRLVHSELRRATTAWWRVWRPPLTAPSTPSSGTRDEE